MFAFEIAPSAMNGSAASGLSLIRAKPSASSIASSAALEHHRGELLHLPPASMSAAPLTAPRPVTANWLAYVPEKPGVGVPVAVVPGADVHLSTSQPMMSATTCAAVVSCPWPCGVVPSVTTTSPKMSSLTVATSLFPENWRSGLISCDWPKLFVPESSVEPMPKPEQLAARRRLAPPLLDAVVADQLERHVQRARIVARVVDAAVRRLVRHVLRLDEVLACGSRPGRSRAPARRCRSPAR